MDKVEKNFYPNSWYVMQDICGRFMPMLGSVGNKSYSMGYLNALCSFLPHPEYKLVNNKCEIVEVRTARCGIHLN